MAESMEEQLLSLLEYFRGRLPDADVSHVRSMVEHREWGIGLEDLCTQLHEHSVQVNSSELAWIQALTSEMDLPPETWDFLEDRVRDS
jgi:hypothetical protein